MSAKAEWVDTAPKKNYFAPMNNFKNLLIAILTGLLALSLFTQPAQSAGTSTEAKIVQYTVCLEERAQNARDRASGLWMDDFIKLCAKYRP